MSHKQSNHPKTSSFYNFLSAILAFILWGGWAYYINGRENPEMAIISAITQGTASFTITLLMVHAVSWIYHRLPKNSWQILLPAIFTVSVTGSCLAAIHYTVGTPEIIYTISPALSVAFAFCLYTAYKLRKASHKQESL
ncbi:MAG: hypothetical protein GQ569_01150 [Methylococcaceae bacterium]|nr:hypothetical protein [Methylococcaceae bacterium]